MANRSEYVVTRDSVDLGLDKGMRLDHPDLKPA